MRLSNVSAMVFTAALVAVLGVSAGCGDTKPSRPQAAVLTTIGPGDEIGVNDTEKCQLASEKWIDFGDLQNDVVVPDGETVGTTPLTITCTVRPDGDGFFVDAEAKLGDARNFTVNGRFTSSGAQSNISGFWSDARTGSFTQTDCTATYPSRLAVSIKAGAVWATITCPHATLGAQPPRVCEATAEFRFENCTQE